MWQQEGFLQGAADVNNAMSRLESYIEYFPAQLKKFSEEELLYKPAPGKWSKKEITGHLIDSAINNLKRFTDIPFLPQPYVVVPYKQDELVTLNNYQQLPLDHILNFWQSLNKQIIFVVRNIPADKLEYLVDAQYENRELKKLIWIIGDYVAHMEHHFKQIF